MIRSRRPTDCGGGGGEDNSEQPESLKTKGEDSPRSLSSTRCCITRVLRLAVLPLLLFLAIILLVDPRYKDQIAADGRPSLTAAQAAQENAHQIQGHVFVVTGAYGGLGKETAKALVEQGGHVVLAGRSRSKLDALAQELKKGAGSGSSRIEARTLDLSDLASVHAFCQQVLQEYQQNGITIINNAATICPAAVTAQGLEMQMGVNVVGHFLLNKLLLPITKRQVWVSSTGHQIEGGHRLQLEYYKRFAMDKDAASYEYWMGYQQSKLGGILMASEFHHRYPDSLETASLHPGVIWTSLGKDIYESTSQIVKDSVEELVWLVGCEGFWFVKTPAQGAATTITAASLPSEEFANGAYYKDSAAHYPSQEAQNQDDAKALFDWCEEVTKEYQS